MTFAEPMTMATDYVLAGLGLWLGCRLWGRGGRWWAVSFWAMALAALLGGSAHGFAPMLSDSAQSLIWRSTLVVLGSAAVLLVFASLRSAGAGAGWFWLLAAELVVYATWVCFVDSDFRYAVLQYGTALVVVLIVHLMLAARRPGALVVVGGILISFAAAWIQQAGISPHPHFNHNDLYHLVQMLGLVVLYRGAAAGLAPTRQPPRQP